MLNENDLNESAVGGVDKVPELKYEYKTPFFADGLNSYWLREISQITLDIMKFQGLHINATRKKDSSKNPVEIQASFVGDKLILSSNKYTEDIEETLKNMGMENRREDYKRLLNEKAEKIAEISAHKAITDKNENWEC